ncbi:MAG: HEAT repeat domain-containing protein, partial [Myxococcota bacterium]|nr:HEAT repeat domain-containing protein [Myxococcota bacterium]
VSQIPYIVGIVPNLCRVKRYADAAKVVDVLEVHRGTPGPFEGRERLVDAAMRELEGGPTLKMLIAGMVNEPSEVRTILRRLIRIMGKRAVSPLLQVIEETDSEEVKSDCALTLVGVGDVVRQPIEHILLQRSSSDDGARYLLKALIELGHEDSTDVFVAYTRHRTPAVREEALRCVARLHGVAACNVLTRATTDTSPSVAARAIRLLSDQKSKHPGYLYVLLQVLGLAPMSASELRETPVSLQVVAVEALGKLPSQAELGQLGTVESLLLRCLERDEGTMMSLLQRGKVEDKDKVRVAVCDVLGDAGSKLSLERLSQHAREPSPLVRPRMARAASRIQRRLAEASS